MLPYYHISCCVTGLLQLFEPLNSFVDAHCVLAEPCYLRLSCCNVSLDLVAELPPDKLILFNQPPSSRLHFGPSLHLLCNAQLELPDFLRIDVLPLGA